MYTKLIFSPQLNGDKQLLEVILQLRQKNISVEFADISTLNETDRDNQTLLIGTNEDESLSAQKSNLDFALATWLCNSFRHIKAAYYFRQPYDILNLLTSIEQPYKNMKWLTTAMEMQFIAQAGLAYTKDRFDHERFTRLSEMAAEIMAEYTDLPKEKVQNLFCGETGYQTPKIDTRSVIFKDDKILLVKEIDGRWSMPGGWVDVNQSICDNVIKEAREEAGLNVVPTRLVAIHDRNRHNTPLYAYGIAKIFMLCEVVDGHFSPNIETSESAYFSLDNLPNLSVGKNTKEQIRLCFAAYKDKNWVPVID